MKSVVRVECLCFEKANKNLDLFHSTTEMLHVHMYVYLCLCPYVHKCVDMCYIYINMKRIFSVAQGVKKVATYRVCFFITRKIASNVIIHLPSQHKMVEKQAYGTNATWNGFLFVIFYCKKTKKRCLDF